MSPDSRDETTARGPLGLPRAFWLLFAGTLVNRLGGGVFPFLAVYLTRARGFEAQTAGTVVGLYMVGGMVAGPLGGILCDRWGRRPVLLASSLLAAAVMLALGQAQGHAAIVCLAPLLGFLTDLGRPALAAAIADVVPAVDRSRAYGLQFWAINLGFAGAASLAGLLADWSFFLLFAIDAATTFAFGVIVYLGVPESAPLRVVRAAPAMPASGNLAKLILPLRDHAFLAFAGIQLCVMFVFQQALVTLPLEMAGHGLPAAEIGRLLALNGFAIIVLQPVALRWLAGRPRARTLAWGTAIIGLGFGMFALPGGGGWHYGAAIVVFTLGEIAISCAAPSVVADLSPAVHRGAYQGAYHVVWGLSGVLAPWWGTFVLSRMGSSALWLGCAALGGLAAVLHATVMPRLMARPVAAPVAVPVASGASVGEQAAG